jgi:hypothetical protein
MFIKWFLFSEIILNVKLTIIFRYSRSDMCRCVIIFKCSMKEHSSTLASLLVVIICRLSPDVLATMNL